MMVNYSGGSVGDNFSFETALKIKEGPQVVGIILAISLTIIRKRLEKHSNEFFDKMKSMEGVRLPGERRHKNRRKGPRNINEELVNKIKSLS
ncbi:MAG: hypothetical protein CM1200mP5_3080 [Candidatus Pelagibacterales bacterium]|nr:MAG: hypothetical protein CM1200mP5_3080 [Pelagibacterales bacterium]